MSRIRSVTREDYSWKCVVEEQIRWLASFKNIGPNEAILFDIIKQGGEGMITPVLVKKGETKDVFFTNNNDTLYVITRIRESEAANYSNINTRQGFSDPDVNTGMNIIKLTWNVIGSNTRADSPTHQVIMYPKAD